MNLLLLDPDDIQDKNTAVLTGMKLKHLQDSQRNLSVGRELTIGLLNGNLGKATITNTTTKQLEIKFNADTEPPQATPITLLLAIPRPKMLKRILSMCAELGIKKIYLINCWKTDKAYLQSDILQPTELRHYLRKGLEQACDTVMPEVQIRDRFKPFVEDELEAICHGHHRLLAQPGSSNALEIASKQACCLFIGPEAGLNDFEIQLLKQHGFQDFSLGDRILRVETAVSFSIATVQAVNQALCNG